MDSEKTRNTRSRLVMEREKLIQSITRNKIATDEITLENTEDECDLATISHNRELLVNLGDGDFLRLKFIDTAMKALNQGRYGECIQCGTDINEKRLNAVPWATRCIECQEEMETKQLSSRMVTTESESNDEPEF